MALQKNTGDQVNISVQGVKELQIILDQLPAKLGRKMLIAGMKKAAKPMVSRIRGLAPVSESGSYTNRSTPSRNHPAGNLRKSVGTLAGRDKIEAAIWIGARSGRKFKNDGWYKGYVHEGLKNKNYVANPFVREGYEQTVSTVEGSFTRETARYIDNFFKKYAFKG